MIVAPSGPVRRVVYVGTPALAVPPLLALLDSGVDVPLVVSQPDARRGRGGELTPSPVKAAALGRGIAVSDDLAAIDDVKVDLGVAVAFGRILPADLLDRLAFVNLHFSLLPRWRGAAPVERAILAGDSHTGVCLMAIAEELDTGGVYRRDVVSIDPDETLDELRSRLVELGCQQLAGALAAGLEDAVPQIGEAVYARKIAAEERVVDWSASPVHVHRQIRVGGAFTTWEERRLKIHRSALDLEHAEGVVVPSGDGAIALLEVQPEGKSRMSGAAWANGARYSAGERLGP